MRASRPETGDDAPSLLPDAKLTEATLGDTKDSGWDVLSLPLPPVSRGTRLEINEKPPAAGTGGLHPRCFFFFPQVCELNPISLGGKLREPYFGLEESSPSPRTGPPFSGGSLSPSACPCKAGGIAVSRAAGTDFFCSSTGCGRAASHLPICYPMARGATLAEMYEISCGKNMHADPHLVSPIMEV